MKGGTGVYYQAIPAVGPDGKNVMKLIPVQNINGQFFQKPLNVEQPSVNVQWKASSQSSNFYPSTASHTQSRFPLLQQVLDKPNVPNSSAGFNPINPKQVGTNGIQKAKPISQHVFHNLSLSVPQTLVPLGQKLPVNGLSSVFSVGNLLQTPQNIPATFIPSIKCSLVNPASNSSNTEKVPPSRDVSTNPPKRSSDQQACPPTKPGQTAKTPSQNHTGELRTSPPYTSVPKSKDAPIKWVVHEASGASGPCLVPLSTTNPIKLVKLVNSVNTTTPILQESSQATEDAPVARKSPERSKDVSVSKATSLTNSTSPDLPTSTALVIDLCDDEEETMCPEGFVGISTASTQTETNESDEESNVIFVSYIPPKSTTQADNEEETTSPNESQRETLMQVQEDGQQTDAPAENNDRTEESQPIQEPDVDMSLTDLSSTSKSTDPDQVQPLQSVESPKQVEEAASRSSVVHLIPQSLPEASGALVKKFLVTEKSPHLQIPEPENIPSSPVGIIESLMIEEGNISNIDTVETTKDVSARPLNPDPAGEEQEIPEIRGPEDPEPVSVDTNDTIQKTVNPDPEHLKSDCALRKEFGITCDVRVCLEKSRRPEDAEAQTEKLLRNAMIDGLRAVIQESKTIKKISPTRPDEDKDKEQERSIEDTSPDPPPPASGSRDVMMSSTQTLGSSQRAGDATDSSPQEAETPSVSTSSSPAHHRPALFKHKATQTTDYSFSPSSARKTPPRSKRRKLCTACPCGTLLGSQDRPNPCAALESHTGTRSSLRSPKSSTDLLRKKQRPCKGKAPTQKFSCRMSEKGTSSAQKVPRLLLSKKHRRQRKCSFRAQALDAEERIKLLKALLKEKEAALKRLRRSMNV